MYRTEHILCIGAVRGGWGKGLNSTVRVFLVVWCSNDFKLTLPRSKHRTTNERMPQTHNPVKSQPSLKRRRPGRLRS